MRVQGQMAKNLMYRFRLYDDNKQIIRETLYPSLKEMNNDPYIVEHGGSFKRLTAERIHRGQFKGRVKAWQCVEIKKITGPTKYIPKGKYKIVYNEHLITESDESDYKTYDVTKDYEKIQNEIMKEELEDQKEENNI